MRVLLIDLGRESAGAATEALSGQGYEIAAHSGLSVDEVLALDPGVLVTEATPSDLTCCGLITQLKSGPDAHALRILMVVHGGALERARALDLGADDVISFPLESVEFAARIRTQFREREPGENLKAKLKEAEQREHLAELAVESLSGGAVTKRRFWLIPAIFALSAIAVIATVLTVVSSRKSQRDALQLRAEVARLSSGIGQQEELLRRAQDARDTLDAQTRSASETRNSLKAQSDVLRQKMASADRADISSLERQLQETQDRLKQIEMEGRFAETIVHNYGSSVCLLHVVVEFLDKSSGKPIQIVVDSAGKPQVDDKGMTLLAVGGNGPHFRLDVFGTGFLVRRDGRILTNHHVAEPWWNDDDLKDLLNHGAAAYVVSYTAYFPGSSEGIKAGLDRISTQADVTTLKLEGPPPIRAALLPLDDRNEASVTGDPVVLIGYPTAIEGILARAGPDVTQKIMSNAHDVSQILSRLAFQKLIRPTTTQGHIGDVLKDKIVYDAATTSGGSGGPLLNRKGKVIGVNFAILNGFGGSNLAVPVRYTNELLK